MYNKLCIRHFYRGGHYEFYSISLSYLPLSKANLTSTIAGHTIHGVQAYQLVLPAHVKTGEYIILANDRQIHKDKTHMLAAAISTRRQCSTHRTYLPGVGDTLILKGVPPGRDLSIALRAG